MRPDPEHGRCRSSRTGCATSPATTGGAGKSFRGQLQTQPRFGVSGAGGQIRRPKATGVALDRTALPVPLPVAPAETPGAPVGGRWSPPNAPRDRRPFVRRGPRATMSRRPRWSAVRSGIVRWPRSCVRRPDRQRRSPRGGRPHTGPSRVLIVMSIRQVIGMLASDGHGTGARQ